MVVKPTKKVLFKVKYGLAKVIHACWFCKDENIKTKKGGVEPSMTPSLGIQLVSLCQYFAINTLSCVYVCATFKNNKKQQQKEKCKDMGFPWDHTKPCFAVCYLHN